MKTAFGIDIGGSGTKGAPVDLESGRLVTERFRIPTPSPSTPEAIADVLAQIVAECNWNGPIGCTAPAVVQRGIARTAANIDPSWIDMDVQSLFSQRLALPVHVLNDADAAGIAEMTYGAGRSVRERGVVLILTFGTGIGSAISPTGR